MPSVHARRRIHFYKQACNAIDEIAMLTEMASITSRGPDPEMTIPTFRRIGAVVREYLNAVSRIT